MTSNMKQTGFSLIELMISLVIGLIITAALASLFTNVNNANTEMAKTNSQIESGRFTMQVIKDSVQRAGYWDDYVPNFQSLTSYAVPNDIPTAIPNPCLSYSAWDDAHKRNLIGIPVQAYGTVVPADCGAILTSRKTSADTLVIRHAEACLPGENNCEDEDSANVYFQSSKSFGGYCPVPRVADATPYIISKTGLDSTFTDKDCLTPVTKKRKFISDIFYVATLNGVPTLMMSTFNRGVQQAPVALVDGIEGFVVELGIDNVGEGGVAVNYAQGVRWEDTKDLMKSINRGDGVADEYVRCTTATPCTLDELINVVSVNLHVLVRAESPTRNYSDTKVYNLGGTSYGPFGDNYKRHVFSTNIQLSNVAIRRDTP